MKLSQITVAVAFAASVASPLVASASEWAFDDPYWKQALSSTASSEAPALDRSADTDLFGRPLVHLEGTEGFARFEPLPQFWASAHPQQPVSYAAVATPARDVAGIDEVPARQSGAAIVEANNAELAELAQAGFPQFAQ